MENIPFNAKPVMFLIVKPNKVEENTWNRMREGKREQDGDDNDNATNGLHVRRKHKHKHKHKKPTCKPVRRKHKHKRKEIS